MNQFLEELKDCQQKVERELDRYFRFQLPQQTLLDAMRYSLMAGGKRIRPVLVLKFCEAAGGELDQALPLACAVEMMHTYSLIHDDLPCMDNDDLRRGKPTNHKVFGEFTATLAGDALQAAAFQTVLSAPYSAKVMADAAFELSRAVGVKGMCGGQQLDMEGENQMFSLEQIANMNRLKTGCLLRASCVIGVLAAGVKRDDLRISAAAAYADAIGLAFQIRDDMLNVTASAVKMGKPVGNDSTSHKSTYVSLLGLERCRTIICEKTTEAKQAIQSFFVPHDFLSCFADYLANRTY